MRLPPDATITVRIRATGERLHLGLLVQPGGRRVWVERDRRRSRRRPEATITEVFAVLRAWTAGRLRGRA